jgi:hypothetical protein
MPFLKIRKTLNHFSIFIYSSQVNFPATGKLAPEPSIRLDSSFTVIEKLISLPLFVKVPSVAT